MMLSLEYLMLSLVSLCLLTVSVFALLGIKEYSENSSERFAFRTSAVSLNNAMNEICSLGNGNSRSVFLHYGLSVEPEEGGARFTGSNYSMVKAGICDVEPAGNLEGLVYIENKEGIIRIRGQ